MMNMSIWYIIPYCYKSATKKCKKYRRYKAFLKIFEWGFSGSLGGVERGGPKQAKSEFLGFMRVYGLQPTVNSNIFSLLVLGVID